MVSYEINDDIAELRRGALSILLAATFVVAVAIMVVGMIYTEITHTSWPISPQLLVIAVVIWALGLKRRHTAAAAWLLIGGLLAGPSLFLWQHGPGQGVYFFFVLPV